MYHIAFRIVQNQEDAEDAVHQAFEKIAENISKIFDPDCPKTRAFIVTIVENKAIDIYNRRKKAQEVPMEEALVGMTVEYSGDHLLAECLSKLPPRYRNLLLLKYYHGYTTKEVAKLLNITLSNAARIEQRAKAKLEVLCKESLLL
jgi:RNA polymerase sigma-70 factor (ECF subfamily)